MSLSSPSPSSVNVCRWEWCRDTFETGDKLAKHVLDNHVANLTPVRREDVRLELRAHDGASYGEDSIRASLLMNEDAFLADDDKETVVLGHGNEYISRSPTRQETTRSDASQQYSNGHEPASRPELTLVTSPLNGPEPPNLSSLDGQHSSESARSAPSPAPSGFQALAEASSCSPDPEHMAVAPSPSIAEMLANTINGVHNSPTAGPSNRRRAGSHVLPKLLNPKRARVSSRTPSDQGTISPSRMQMGQNSQPSNGNGLRSPFSHSRPRSRSRSQTPANSSIHNNLAYRAQASPTLPSISETVPSPDAQSRLNTSPLTRLFRTGSIRLEPSTPPEPLNNPSPLQPNTGATTQPHPETHSQVPLPAPPDPLDPAQQTSNPFMDDMDMLSTSLDPSIPAFTQAFDVQGQSQWPLATQAPYSFDSQLTFSSQ